ncbi:hypothetical protein N7G274_008076 [Stereocaulon virgatum]|uniref:Uncharacterized protein n=1 Tax=Stereocaulon virgatum TaxID=373712 RepID=A0ABR3ZZB0_9LECA
MVSKIFTYVGTSFLIAFAAIGVVFGVFNIYTYFRDRNSNLIGKLEKDIATIEGSNNVRIAHLRGLNRVAQADHFTAEMTRAREKFCEDIRLASLDDKLRLASHRTYFRKLADIDIETETARALAARLSDVLRPPSVPQISVSPQRGLIRPPRRTDKYQMLANGESTKPPASAASTHASVAVENVRPPTPQIPAVEERGTITAAEVTARAPAAAEPKDADSAVAEQADEDAASTGGSIRLKTLRSARSLDGDSAYFSIESSNTPTE